MMMREHVLEKLDELLADYAPYEKRCASLLFELSYLFDGHCGPLVKIANVRGEDGRLAVRVYPSVDDTDDYNEWCAAFRDYIEDRFEVIPQYPHTISISIDDIRDSSFSFGYIGDDLESSPTSSATGGTLHSDEGYLVGSVGWLGDSYIPPHFGKDARVVHPPKAKLTVQPPPPHVALYQQRGSKGKRKNW
jgi:hypothetical protein